MTWPDVYLLCLVVGGLWSAVTLFGGIGFGAHLHGLGHGHLHGHFHGPWHGAAGHHATSMASSIITPSSAAIFLAWFGGAGYLLTRHSPWSALLDFAVAATLGLVGVLLLALFFRWMQTKERPLDPADYRMAGVLGKVSCSIRPNGVGEVIYLRDGARTPLPARSDAGVEIARGEEVIVTRYEKGIAYVRTWNEMNGSHEQLS